MKEEVQGRGCEYKGETGSGMRVWGLVGKEERADRTDGQEKIKLRRQEW